MEMKLSILLLCGLTIQALAAPVAEEENLPPVFFKDGSVGVNFLGFKASAGLGGILTGDANHGGLHASAETPFGQKAAAGLGGTVDGNGRSAGGLYAGATAGGGVGAMAGIEGLSGSDGSMGRSYAGASAGGVQKTVVKERIGEPVAPEGPSSTDELASHTSHVKVVKEKAIVATPLESRVNIEFKKEVFAAPPSTIKKTNIEKTIVPNYIEENVPVSSYVQKTILVPTVRKEIVQVAASPTIFEKEVEKPAPARTVTKWYTKNIEEAPEAPTSVVKTKTKIVRRPWLRKFIRGEAYYGAPYYGGVQAGTAQSDVHFGQTGTAGQTNAYPGVSYSKTVRKEFNGNLLRDIFNIPIATLNAVGNLVGNAAGSGSLSVSKSYGHGTSYQK